MGNHCYFITLHSFVQTKRNKNYNTNNKQFNNKYKQIFKLNKKISYQIK